MRDMSTAAGLGLSTRSTCRLHGDGGGTPAAAAAAADVLAACDVMVM